MTLGLTDLDELIETILDQDSKRYIIEALNAYRGGAYRAAIISTWIAVFYDIISKLRALYNISDDVTRKEIEKILYRIDNHENMEIINKTEKKSVEKETKNHRHKGKKKKSLESCILDEIQKEPFEFLTKIEYDDLERLRQDRHKCAHPAYNSESKLFQPTPELVRYHIINAIRHLLQYPPLQGKTALKRFKLELKQPIYSEKREDIIKFINTIFPQRLSDTAIKNLTTDLLHELLIINNSELIGKEDRLVLSLKVIAENYEKAFNEVRDREITELNLRMVEGDKLYRIFRLLQVDNTCWKNLSETIRTKLKQIIKDKTAKKIKLEYKVFSLIKIEDLEEIIVNSFDDLNPKEQEDIIAETLPPPHLKFVDKAANLFIQVYNPSAATVIGNRILIPFADYFSVGQIKDILLNGVIGNENVRECDELPRILEKFFDATKKHLEIMKDVWQKLILSLINTLDKQYDDEEKYNGLKLKLEEHNIEYKSLIFEQTN